AQSADACDRDREADQPDGGGLLMLSIRRGAVLPFIAVLGVSCSSSSSTSPATTSTPLIVFAASSLTKAFTQIGQDFHTAHPNVTVPFDFRSSTDLPSQSQSAPPA